MFNEYLSRNTRSWKWWRNWFRWRVIWNL